MKPKKYQAGGTVKGNGPKAPNEKGAFITVQKRTLGSKGNPSKRK
jgi:hypothetical protein